jgi:hypothetical protein
MNYRRFQKIAHFSSDGISFRAKYYSDLVEDHVAAEISFLDGDAKDDCRFFVHVQTEMLRLVVTAVLRS